MAPASLLLVHGAGSGPWIYDEWPASFPALRVAAVDLQEGIDVGRASMTDYAERVVAAARALPAPVALPPLLLPVPASLSPAPDAEPAGGRRTRTPRSTWTWRCGIARPTCPPSPVSEAGPC